VLLALQIIVVAATQYSLMSTEQESVFEIKLSSSDEQLGSNDQN
jgi:hypothetical protein